MTMPVEVEWLLRAIALLSSLVVLFLAEPAINRMSPCTNGTTRFAFHLITVGGFGNTVFILLGDRPSVQSLFVLAGLALLLLCERRRKKGDSLSTKIRNHHTTA